MVATAHGSHAPLSLIMIDLDHFKRFNDTHGHLAGDQALRTAAGVLGSALRPTDFAVRYGGEEMMVLLPDTSEKVAVAVAERLCERMRRAGVQRYALAAAAHYGLVRRGQPAAGAGRAEPDRPRRCGAVPRQGARPQLRGPASGSAGSTRSASGPAV
jgi:GGDEF domain-containing protein